MAPRKGRPPVVWYNTYPRPLYDCPRCGCGVAWSEQWRCKFCPECGQKINWEGFPPEKDDSKEYYDWRLVDLHRYEDEIRKKRNG